MSKKVSKVLDKKNKMQEKILQLEREMKELEQKAFEEVGRFVFKEWEIDNEVDSKTIYKLITHLKDQAQEFMLSDEMNEDMGKSEE